jgi:Delta3-Delta2-enoyl-CoA isomerase
LLNIHFNTKTMNSSCFLKNKFLTKYPSFATTTTTTTKEFFQIDYNQSERYAIWKLNKPPVNSLSLDFVQALIKQINEFNSQPNIDGIIITSNLKNIFCAGLDIMEMYKAPPDRMKLFWWTFQEFFLKLYGNNKVYISCINGHAPAGGCVISNLSDYRIMAKGQYKIGLNETRLGIKPPQLVVDTMINTVGHRNAEYALQVGHLFEPDEALRINLIDQICEPNVLIETGVAELKKWLQIPNDARSLTKQEMRKKTINNLLTNRQRDVDEFVRLQSTQTVQNNLQVYLNNLKKK